MKSARYTGAPSRYRLLAVLAAGGLAACAGMDTDLSAARESWRGATYDQVVSAWGPPARNTRDSYTWLSDDLAPPAQRSGGGAGGVLFSAGPAARCERTLIIQDARVVRAADWAGDPDFCKRFARR